MILLAGAGSTARKPARLWAVAGILRLVWVIGLALLEWIGRTWRRSRWRLQRISRLHRLPWILRLSRLGWILWLSWILRLSRLPGIL